jgi:DNA-binding FadR family transcriptional regulator
MSEALFRPARPRRAFDEIISQVQDLIRSGELAPGDRLPSERALAEQMMVSRNTVREALRMLEISGVVKLRRGRLGGAYITGIGTSAIAATISQRLALTDFSLQDLTDCMRWLCGLVVRQVGPSLTAEDFAALEASTEAGARLRSVDDRVERARVLTEFYNVLARAGENPVLAVLVESLTSILREVVPRLEIADHSFVIRARRRILALLEEGDVEGAAAELDAYLVELHARWLERDHGRVTHSLAEPRPERA